MIEATYIDHMGTDLSVVNAARVSFGKKSTWSGQEGGLDDGEGGMGVLNDTDTKLINYLAKHKHTSPFGHCFASFHIKAPVFVARQLVKHKFLRWNEISRRYVDDKPEFYVPDAWRLRSEDKKQGSSNESIKEFLVQGADISLPDYLKETMEISDGYDSVINESCLAIYKDFIKAGVAPEQARMVLPQSTMTEWYWSGSLDAFTDMCILRCKDDTQEETRQVADQISTVMKDLFPISWEALTKGYD